MENNEKKNEVNNEESSGMLLGILSYFGILSLIPYFVEKKNSFVVYHAKQGLNLFLLELIGGIGASILDRFLRLPSTLSRLVGLCGIVLSIIGIVYVCQGNKKELPLIEKIKLIK